VDALKLARQGARDIDDRAVNGENSTTPWALIAIAERLDQLIGVLAFAHDADLSLIDSQPKEW